MKHTQGNWEVFIQPQPMPHGNARTINSGTTRIATLEFMPSIEESEANARLIAAAPELLEALELFTQLDKDHHGIMPVLLRPAFSRARAAINNAIKP